MSFKDDDMSYRPQDMLELGRSLLKDAHKEYLDMQKQGHGEDESYWSAFEGVCTNNFDELAVIWAAGAVDFAIHSEDVMEAIEEAICFG